MIKEPAGVGVVGTDHLDYNNPSPPYMVQRVCSWRKSFGILPVFGFVLIAYFAAWGAINGLGVNARFRMPVNLFIFMFAAYGCLNLIVHTKTFITKRYS